MWKVMICDDESLTINGMKRLINDIDLDIEVVGTAQNGQIALDKIKELRPNIVLIDINMPIINGLEVINKIKDEHPNIRFIIISGYSDFEYAQTACHLQVVDYLLKPISKNKLKESLQRAIDILKNSLNTKKIYVPDKSDDLNSKILTYISQNYSDMNFDLENVSSKFNISSSYVSKIIKRETNETFSNYLNDLRINYAKELLLSSDKYTFEDIAFKCGFSSYHYFSRVFKNKTGITANYYRNINKK